MSHSIYIALDPDPAKLGWEEGVAYDSQGLPFPAVRKGDRRTDRELFRLYGEEAPDMPPSYRFEKREGCDAVL